MIVLLTDFGLEGPYIGQVEAVLLQQAPGVPVIKLFSDLPVFDIQSAAYLLPAYSSRFPPGTVFLCVVDPGVGSDRPGVAVKADSRWFVGPNEGLFALLARRAGSVECWQLPGVEDASPCFHGRDVFAPAAARLVREGRPAGEPALSTTLARPDWPDDLMQVVYIDRFGNAITGLRGESIAPDAVLQVEGYALQAARAFSDVTIGAPFWYENSNGLVEIAVNQGRADAVLDITIGTLINLQERVEGEALAPRGCPGACPRT